jgi:hypothetical protein
MAKSKRDLAKPLADSKFDPADYNNDGHVSPSEQKKYNRVQKLKKKGSETPSEKTTRRMNVAKGIVKMGTDVANVAINAKSSSSRNSGGGMGGF